LKEESEEHINHSSVMKQSLRVFLLMLLSVAFTTGPVTAQSTEQLLRPGDSIIVKLSGVPPEEITVVSNTYDISDQGTINLPYIGEVRAAGTRPSQLQKNIESTYKSKEIFTHPTVQVTPNRGESNTQVIYVSGEVKTPRAVPMTPGMTIHDAITTAGGPTDFANMRKIKLTRNTVTRIVDLKKADSPDAQIQAQPGDKIHVPQ
jgi:protein involved in polysaccharide export with SLBB domain